MQDNPGVVIDAHIDSPVGSPGGGVAHGSGGAVSKAQLLRGIRRQKRGAFPPFMAVPTLFLLLVVYLVTSSRQVSEHFEMTRSLQQDFVDAGGDGATFRDINSIDGFWEWLENVLPPAVATAQANVVRGVTRRSSPVVAVLSQTRDACNAPPDPDPGANPLIPFPDVAPGFAAPPRFVAGSCIDTTRATVLETLDNRTDLVRSVAAITGAKQSAVALLNSTGMCEILCALSAGSRCGSWTLRHPDQCTTYQRELRRPPAWIVPPHGPSSSGCVASGQVERQYLRSQCDGKQPTAAALTPVGPFQGPCAVRGGFTNWQCPAAFAAPRYSTAFEPGLPVVDVHASTFRCSAQEPLLGLVPQDACIALGAAVAPKLPSAGALAKTQQLGFTTMGALVSALRQLRWLDGSTRSVNVQIVLVNFFAAGASGAAAIIDFSLAVGTTGSVAVSTRTGVVIGLKNIEGEHSGSDGGADFLLQPGALAAAAFVVAIYIQHLVAGYRYERAGRRLEHLRTQGFWLLVETLLLGFSIGLGSAVMRRSQQLVVVRDGFGNFANDPAQVLASIRAYFDSDRTCERCGTAIIYCVTLRLFRFFWRQPRLAMVTRTLLLALPDLMHFVMIFALVLLGFAASASASFGGQLAEFSTLEHAFFTSVMMAFGSYEDTYQNMVDVGQRSARLFFFPFLFFVVIVLVNIFLAIVLDAYADVKDELQAEFPRASGGVPSVVESSLSELHRMRGAARRAVSRGACTATGLRRRRGGGGGGGGGGGEDGGGSHAQLRDEHGGEVELTEHRLSLADASGAPGADGGGAVPVTPQRSARHAVAQLCAGVSWPELSRALDSVASETVSAQVLQTHLRPHASVSLEEAQLLLDEYSALASTVPGLDEE